MCIKVPILKFPAGGFGADVTIKVRADIIHAVTFNFLKVRKCSLSNWTPDFNVFQLNKENEIERSLSEEKSSATGALNGGGGGGGPCTDGDKKK